MSVIFNRFCLPFLLYLNEFLINRIKSILTQLWCFPAVCYREIGFKKPVKPISYQLKLYCLVKDLFLNLSITFLRFLNFGSTIRTSTKC